MDLFRFKYSNTKTTTTTIINTNTTITITEDTAGTTAEELSVEGFNGLLQKGSFVEVILTGQLVSKVTIAGPLLTLGLLRIHCSIIVTNSFDDNDLKLVILAL